MWKKVDGKDNYEVSALGDIRNTKTGRILKKSVRKDGYCQIMLGRKTVPLYVHRVVATAFIPNPKQLPQVDHINGLKEDNRVDNLRWTSVLENNLSHGYYNRVMGKWKPIRATNVITGEVINFKSRDATANHFSCNKALIKYNYTYKKGNKKNWYFELVEDIV